MVRSPARDETIARVSRAFLATEDERLRHRAVVMENCCAFWCVSAPLQAPELARPHPMHCWDRLCPNCARAKAANLAPKLVTLMQRARSEGRRVRFLTLTQRTDPSEGPREARRAGAQAFTRLRHRKAWRVHVRGWMAKYEETFTEGTGWHAHLHVIFDGVWWDRDEIAAAWESATRGRADARVAVDIREAREGAERELLKYATKAATLPDAEIVRYAEAMSGARDITTGGTWYGATSDEELERDGDNWPDYLGDVVTSPLTAVETRARFGDSWSVRALAAIDERIAAAAAVRKSGARASPQRRQRRGG